MVPRHVPISAGALALLLPATVFAQGTKAPVPMRRQPRSLLFRVSIAAALAGGAALASCSDEPIPVGSEFPLREGRLIERYRIDGHREGLVPISRIAVSENDILVINQQLDASLRFYSTQGTFVGAFGRRGEGPGEFQNPMEVGWFADTLWVYEGFFVPNKVTLVSPDRTLIATLSGFTGRVGELGSEYPSAPFSFVLGLGPDRSLVVLFTDTSDGVPARYRGRTMIGWTQLDGTVISVPATLPQSDHSRYESRLSGVRLPFPNDPQFAVSSMTGRVAIAHAALQGPLAETFEVTYLTLAGDTIFDRRFQFESDVIPSRVVDDAINHIMRTVEGQGSSANVERILRGTVPPIYPPITDIFIGNDGSIWIEQRPKDGQRAYYVIDADGAPYGRILLNDSGRLGAATLDRIWVISSDSLGVESVIHSSIEWN